ncbi:hypothetical protein C8R44DRAFT_761687 [Mycena epipterygia]|nr:hypothetical protein C8R44DRAFT_761687 [Mycena epipterygia]
MRSTLRSSPHRSIPSMSPSIMMPLSIFPIHTHRRLLSLHSIPRGSVMHSSYHIPAPLSPISPVPFARGGEDMSSHHFCAPPAFLPFPHRPPTVFLSLFPFLSVPSTLPPTLPHPFVP